MRAPEVGAINRRQYTRKLQADADFLKQARRAHTRTRAAHARGLAQALTPPRPAARDARRRRSVWHW